MQTPTHKVPGRQNMWAASGHCCGVLLWKLSQGQLVALLYAVHSWACVHYRWHCVSLEEKAHLGRHLVVTPTNSRCMNTARKSWTVGRMVEGGAIPAQRCHPREYCVQSLTQPRCKSTQLPCLVWTSNAVSRVCDLCTHKPSPNHDHVI